MDVIRICRVLADRMNVVGKSEEGKYKSLKMVVCELFFRWKITTHLESSYSSILCFSLQQLLFILCFFSNFNLSAVDNWKLFHSAMWPEQYFVLTEQYCNVALEMWLSLKVNKKFRTYTTCQFPPNDITNSDRFTMGNCPTTIEYFLSCRTTNQITLVIWILFTLHSFDYNWSTQILCHDFYFLVS